MKVLIKVNKSFLMIIDKLVISLEGRLHTIYFLYAQHYYQVSCLPNVYYCYDLFLKLIYRLWLCMLEYCHVVLSKLNISFGKVQCPLGFATLDKAAALGLATATPLTDLRQYINSDLVFSDLKFRPLYSKIAAVEVVIPSGLEQKLLLATTWSLYQVEILLI